jgi:glycosyltransferase involved in cell wall biosynthesis
LTPYVTALIATRPRWKSLISVSLPSLLKQTWRPHEVVIVADSRPLSPSECASVKGQLARHQITILRNDRMAGVAGSWNTGLADIRTRRPDGFVAILDDDDEWDSDHLQKCVDAVWARDGIVDVVISGLRIVKDGQELRRPAPLCLSIEDFLSGNPGWQGSNTFIRAETLRRAGDFTDGLQSLNDRDLAVRVLSLDNISLGFTGRMTSTWHLGREPDALSRPGAPEKRQGIRQFLALHGHRMSPRVKAAFAERCRQLFGIDPFAEI